ncbi:MULTISPECIES: DUF3857 and transglutaminase domain-containing protein [Acidobacterium]|uniref:DUF3857 domain-containing protein n=1 Tax=Acidobacterium capsulatum (strain ATCC 51196 / DSM 11244 / BCRC 80197 / JCM 7670 / NBRC 15755 / NCIMB 13165 / 161) TaxID=240015 RepID=C1F833_ACIC5|nr:MULTISPECIES: DUF3857 and transglutaminase domain-containing protein [Acidobacterium]ACO32067.1 hypothetical protein ACP_0079 [Acidobacterium capsulatum ATCC 51196]HCT59269.1 DUF3857 domain-containing protein [Acidobacterium sp.]
MRGPSQSRLARLGFALCLLAAAAPLAMARTEPVLPDWVMSAAALNPGKLPPTANAVILYQSELLTVEPDGSAEDRMRTVMKILTPEGRQDATPVASYNKDTPLKSFAVWSISPDGHRFAMKKSDYVDAGYSDDSMLYVDVRYRTADPPGADPGGIIAWEVVQKVPAYMSEDTWQFQQYLPTTKTVFELKLPQGWHHEAVWFRHAPIAPVTEPDGTLRWEAGNEPAVNMAGVPLAPAGITQASRMVVHYAAQPLPQGDALWAKIGNWYDKLSSAQTDGGSPVKTAALGVATPTEDFMTRLDRVATFMQQNIRYVGVEIGIGGLKPHPADAVLEDRYGDCKDKVTLMIAMLDAVGIHSTYVLVDTHRGFVSPHVPSIDGNHAIIAIQIPAGYQNPRLQSVVQTQTGQRYLIFDPTNEYVPIGLLPGYLQGGYGLLVDGGQSQVIALPVMPPPTDTTTHTASLKLAADGTLSGTVKVTMNGASSWDTRNFYAESTAKQLTTHYNQVMGNDFTAFTLQKTTFSQANALTQPFTISYTFTAPAYAHTAGSLLLVRPRVMGSVEQPLNNKPRKYPISFDSLGTWRDTVSIQLPAGYTVDDLPDPVHLDVGFADYTSDVKTVGNTLVYTRQYVQKKLTLPASDYAQLQQLEGAIANDESNSAVLKKD